MKIKKQIQYAFPIQRVNVVMAVINSDNLKKLKI